MQTVVARSECDAPGSDDAIVVRDLVKTYGSLRAVDGLSFTVHRGEIFALLGNPLQAIVVLAVGILCFATIGIVLGGIVKPDSSVAVANLVYLAFSFLGGVFIPLAEFSKGLRDFATLLPSERMNDALQTIWTRGQGLGQTGLDLPVIVLWAVAILLIGSRRFRWE